MLHRPMHFPVFFVAFLLFLMRLITSGTSSFQVSLNSS
jgi:hypothetical protein